MTLLVATVTLDIRKIKEHVLILVLLVLHLMPLVIVSVVEDSIWKAVSAKNLSNVHPDPHGIPKLSSVTVMYLENS